MKIVDFNDGRPLIDGDDEESGLDQGDVMKSE